MLGCCDIKMRNNAEGVHTAKVYIMEGETESLLGKEDVIALGILNMNSDQRKR